MRIGERFKAKLGSHVSEVKELNTWLSRKDYIIGSAECQGKKKRKSESMFGIGQNLIAIRDRQGITGRFRMMNYQIHI